MTPFHALIIIMFLLENNMWEIGCYKVVSEQTSPSTMWFEDEPSGSWWACNASAWWASNARG